MTAFRPRWAGSRGSPGSWRGWLELMRLSNLPTCVTNVLVGTAIGLAAAPASDAPRGFPWAVFAGVAAAVALLYVGGMALNDVVDARIDRAQRPGRPIPSGRIRPKPALVFAVSALALGGAGLALFGPYAFGWGLALLACIVVYDLVHKRTAAAVVLMGACRGLIFVVSAVAVDERADVTTLGSLAGAMAIYIALVTALARREHAPDARRIPTWALAALPVVTLLPALVVPPAHPDRAVAVGLFVVLWLGRSALLIRARPPRAQAAVMGWLSGICLVDAYSLTLLDERAMAFVSIGLFVLTWLGHRRIAGT